MPKQDPTVIETFSFTFHSVPKDKVGDLHALGARLGLNDHEVVLVENVHSYAKKNSHEIKSTDFLMTWIVDHPTFKAIEAVEAFRADGRGNGTTAYPALSTLVEQKILKKVGQGEYARADQKALPPPKKEKKEKKREQHVFGKPGTAVILSYARRNHGRFNNAKLHEVFEKEGRAKNSVSASIAKLLDSKLIKRVGAEGSGSYVLLSKAMTEKKKAIIAEKKDEPKKPVEVETPVEV
jgi:hypothetical protein